MVWRCKKSELENHCIKSWKKYCSDYEIIEWNEKTFDVQINKYCFEAYKNKKYAFVSDYFRIWVLANYGGIYLDTDVELIRNIDELLNNKAFAGCEDEYLIATGLGCGGEKHNHFWKEFLSFYNEDGNLNLTACPVYTTNYLTNKGYKRNNEIQYLDNITIYPKDYFAPADFWLQVPMISPNTFSIHHYKASWITEHFKNTRTRYKENCRCIFLSPH